MPTGTGSGAGTGTGSGAVPPPPTPTPTPVGAAPGPRQRAGAVTQELIRKYAGGKPWHAVVIAAVVVVSVIIVAGAFWRTVGWMNSSEETAGAIATADPEPDATTGEDDIAPAPYESDDPGESDVVADDTEVAAADAEAVAPVVVAAVEPDAAAPEDNFETATGETRTAEGEGAPAVAAPVAAVEPVAPPPALPPPPFSAGPAEPPAAEPVVVATADTTSPCGTPEGLTDEGHLRCLEHVLALATALTPDWHPDAAP